MAKVNIDAYRTGGRPFRIAVEENATIGAQVGTNLTLTSAVTLLSGVTLPAGYTLKPSDLLNGLIQTTSGTAGSDWSLITNIPANVSAVAGLATVGLAVRQTGGTWVTRSLAAGAGISLANASGDAGNPTVAHADTSSVADLTSNNSNGVVIQDYTITFDTFGHVQTVSVGTVDFDARYLQATSVGNGLKIGSNVLSAGESGTEDSTTFLRGDGVWSNALTGDFTVDTSTLKVDSTNDRVGVGTASPQRKFHAVGPQGAVASFPSGVGANVPMTLENNGNSVIALVPSTTGQAGFAVYKDGSASVNGFFRYDVNTSSWLMDVEAVTKWTVTANGFQFHSSTTSFGGGVGVIGVTNATTVPTSNPTGGTVLYAEGGAFKARGSSGTTTTMAAAEPHCGHCGADFAHEWENGPRYGYLAVCVRCMTRGRVSWAEQRGRWQSHAIPAFLALMAWRALERRWLRWRYNVRSLA